MAVWLGAPASARSRRAAGACAATIRQSEEMTSHNQRHAAAENYIPAALGATPLVRARDNFTPEPDEDNDGSTPSVLKMLRDEMFFLESDEDENGWMQVSRGIAADAESGFVPATGSTTSRRRQPPPRARTGARRDRP